MKKSLFILFLLMITMGLSAQKGYYKINKMTYKNNQDLNIAIEQAKAAINKDNSLDALTKTIARKSVVSQLKKQFKQAEENRYAFGYPDGEYTEIGYLDADNNRSAGLIPEIGRIVINDWKNGQVIIAFPVIKTAYCYQFNPDALRKQGSLDPATMVTKVNPVYEGMEVTEINGFPCVPNMTYGKIQEGKTPEHTIIVDSVTYEATLLPGYLLMKNDKEYYYGIYVEGEENRPTFSMSVELVDFKECTLNKKNFQLPEGYKVVKDIKSLNKEIAKGAKKGKLSLDVPESMPENLWP